MLAIYELFQQRGQIKNAPEFIYSILHQTPPPRISGRSSEHSQQLINDVHIDKNIPKKAISLLNNIKEIEPRSSCEGSDSNRPTFFIFRFKQDPREQYVKAFCKELSKNEKYKCGYELGRQGFFRVGITNDLYFSNENKNEFKKWWLMLPHEITRILQKIG